MTLAPGANLIDAIRAHPGEPLELGAGVYVGGSCFDWPHPITITGQGAGTLVRCGLTFGSDTPGICGSVDLAHFGLVPGLPSHGIHVSKCASWRCVDVSADYCLGNGFLGGSQDNVTMERCTARGCGYHGAYLSEGGSHARILDGAYTGNKRMGIWVNGDPNRIYDVEIVGNDAGGNGNVGIGLAAVSRGRLARNRGRNPHGRVAIFDDDGGPAFACHDIDCTGQAGRITVGAGCTGILLPEGR